MPRPNTKDYEKIPDTAETRFEAEQQEQKSKKSKQYVVTF